MLQDVKASMAARPERLRARSQKFYDITPENTASGLRSKLESRKDLEEKEVQSDDVGFSDEQIQAMIDWMEQLWESNEDLRAMVAPENYERLLESLKGELDK